MTKKTSCLYLILLVGVLATVGCGGGATAPVVGPGVLTMYSTSASFGDVAVGNNVTVGVTFANTGASPLTLVQNSISGTGFSTSGIGSGVTLSPGQYTTLDVNFNPSTAGNASGSVTLMSSTCTIPITVPMSGNGVVSSNLVTFGWEASKSAVVGYNVYLRSASGNTWTRLNSTPLATTSYTDVDVQSGQSYIFAVTSVGTTDMESAFSNATEATVPSS